MNDKQRKVDVQERTLPEFLTWQWVLKQTLSLRGMVIIFCGIVIAYFGVISDSDTATSTAVDVAPQTTQVETITVKTEPQVVRDDSTPVFVIPQGGAVTLTPAMLASMGNFYNEIQPAIVFDVVPNGQPQNVNQFYDQPTTGAGRTPLVRGDCGYTFCNYVSFAFFYETQTVSVIDRNGQTHSMTVPQGGWRVNWWDVSNFLANYSTANSYEIVRIYEIAGDQISADLAVRPPGLLNLVVADNEGTEHNLYVIWDSSTTPDFQVGPIDGGVLVDALMTRTTGGDFYLAPGANCLNPEYQEIGHTSGPCPDTEIAQPDWISADGQSGGTFNANGEPMGIYITDPARAPDNQSP